MKYLISSISGLLFLSFTFKAYTQASGSYRFTYQFTFQRDTNDVNSKSKELYLLDEFKDHSTFVGVNKLRADKMMDSMMKVMDSRFGGGGNFMSIARSNAPSTGYILYKYPNSSVEYQSTVGGTLYGYKEQMQLDWKISDSSGKYGDYDCQVATVSYGGRDWKAWFTTDIPVQDGPYKFGGLPGLIVKMEDSKNQCLFELTEVGTISLENQPVPKAEKISKSELVKMTENLNSKPLSAIMGSLPAGVNVNSANIRDREGNPISFEDIEKRRQEALRKNNNRLELK